MPTAIENLIKHNELTLASKRKEIVEALTWAKRDLERELDCLVEVEGYEPNARGIFQDTSTQIDRLCAETALLAKQIRYLKQAVRDDESGK